MSYRLLVERSGFQNISFWDKFMNECGFLDDDDNGIDYYLEPYRAKNVVNEPYIEFETEADATLFLLKWS